MKNAIWAVVLAVSAVTGAGAEEPWLIPVGDPLYREAEELFLNAGIVPPYEELPLAAEDLVTRLRALAAGAADRTLADASAALVDRIVLPFPVISPILETGLGFYGNTMTDRYARVSLEWGLETMTTPADPFDYDDHQSDNGRRLMHFAPFYAVNDLPSLVTAGFILRFAGFSLHFAPELRKTRSTMLENGDFSSLPLAVEQVDIMNTPLVGMTGFYHPHFEARFGRGKLHSGPGQWSSLSLSRTMPYFDHARVRVRYEGISLSTTLVTLNPVISKMESDYLDYLYANDLNPEGNGGMNGKIFRDRIKNYVNIHFNVRPWDWLSLSFMQTNLVGGRPLDFADFNPLLAIHNNFDDGTYSCPVLLSASVVPLKGLRIYAEYFFYDAAVGTEAGDPDANPGAGAIQAGLTWLSTPYFSLGPGRFRLDAEFTYVDPYCYGKYYDLRKFTSRFVYVDGNAGRYWVDYPLGFYLGPDCVDVHARLSYGLPSVWETGLDWQSTAKGEVDLYGYGDDADYANSPTWQGAPTGTPEWTHTLGVFFLIKLFDRLSIDCWYRVSFVWNRYDPVSRTNVPGGPDVFHNLGIAARWKFF